MKTLPLFLVLFAVLACGSEDAGESSAEHETHHDADAYPAVDDPLSVAQRYYDAGSYDHAAAYFEQALDADPGNSRAVLGRVWSDLLAARSSFKTDGLLPPDRIERLAEAIEKALQTDLGEGQWKLWLAAGEFHLLRGDVTAVADGPQHAAVHDARARERYEQVLALEDVPGARLNMQAILGLAHIAARGSDRDGVMRHTDAYLKQTARSKSLWVRSLEKFPEDAAIWKQKHAGTLEREIEVRILRVDACKGLESAEVEADRVLDAARQLESLGDAIKAGWAYGLYLDCANRLGLPEDHVGVMLARGRKEALAE